MVSVSMRTGFARALAGAGAAAFATIACSKDFSGPYPCNPGFESCTTGNSCETDITSDPQNCGACNNQCPHGAFCMTGTCGPAPVAITQDVFDGAFAINTSYAFFPSASDQSHLFGVPKQGGATFQVVSQFVQQPGVLAADDASVYYVGGITTGNLCQPIAASPAAPPDGGIPPPRTLGGYPGNPCNAGAPGSMTVVGPTLFLGAPSNGNQYVVSSIPTSGGPISPVATFSNVNGVAIDSSNVYAIVVANAPCEIDSAPSAGGGSPTTLVNPNDLNNNGGGGCPSALATDGKTVFWASNFSRNRSNNNSSDLVCILSVGGVSPTARVPSVLSSVEANETPLKMVADGMNAYVLTNQSVWRFPTGGVGSPVRVAGNLNLTTNCSGGSGPFNGGCSNSGGGCGMSSQIGLAVDDTSVYLSVRNLQGGTQGGPLYKVPK
jgi:hypothetical protein